MSYITHGTSGYHSWMIERVIILLLLSRIAVTTPPNVRPTGSFYRRRSWKLEEELMDFIITNKKVNFNRARKKKTAANDFHNIQLIVAVAKRNKKTEKKEKE